MQQQLSFYQSKVQLQETKVSDDGNCLFYALSLNAFRTSTHHHKIHHQVADWLEVNAEFEMVCYYSTSLLFFYSYIL